MSVFLKQCVYIIVYITLHISYNIYDIVLAEYIPTPMLPNPNIKPQNNPTEIYNNEPLIDPYQAPDPEKVQIYVNTLKALSQALTNRVILAYQTNGCKISTHINANMVDNSHQEESIMANRNLKHHTMMLIGQETSHTIVRILKDRLAQYIHKKQFKHVESTTFVSDLLEQVQEAKRVSKAVSQEMETKFLSALQMEVIKTIPKGVTSNEVLGLSQGLPCVQRAYRDSMKFVEEQAFTQEPPNILSQRIINNTLNVSRSDMKHPNDPEFNNQWNLKADSPYGINAAPAWELWDGFQRPMTIAVIDSGCDMDHPDLVSKKWVNPGEICGDGIDNDENGYIDDCHGWDFVNSRGDARAEASGHGTGPSGIIAAASNNLLGIAGICWGCKIMCLKFMAKGQGNVSNQVLAIDYAIKMGAWISNNSYGGYGSSELEYEAIVRAQKSGHLFVASAGNQNLNTDWGQNDHTPSSYKVSNIISVAAATPQGTKAAFSNYGKSSVHIFAPGIQIPTTIGLSNYTLANGTSFACPHVAGAAGLIWSAFPNLTYLEVKRALLEGCKKTDQLKDASQCGGLLDLYRSLYIAAQITAGRYPEPQNINTQPLDAHYISHGKPLDIIHQQPNSNQIPPFGYQFLSNSRNVFPAENNNNTNMRLGSIGRIFDITQLIKNPAEEIRTAESWVPKYENSLGFILNPIVDVLRSIFIY